MCHSDSCLATLALRPYVTGVAMEGDSCCRRQRELEPSSNLHYGGQNDEVLGQECWKPQGNLQHAMVSS